jgi:hypothetical protein
VYFVNNAVDGKCHLVVFKVAVEMTAKWADENKFWTYLVFRLS